MQRKRLVTDGLVRLPPKQYMAERFFGEEGATGDVANNNKGNVEVGWLLTFRIMMCSQNDQMMTAIMVN